MGEQVPTDRVSVPPSFLVDVIQRWEHLQELVAGTDNDEEFEEAMIASVMDVPRLVKALLVLWENDYVE